MLSERAKKIHEKLPANWEQVTLSDFIKLGDIDIKENKDGLDGIENSLMVISILTETSIETLENLPMSDLIELGKKIDFIQVEPAPKKKSLFEWKKPNEITYNDFVTYQTLSVDSYKNMPLIIKAFIKNGFDESEILKMPITEVMTGFFLQRQAALKSINHTIYILKKKLRKMMRQQSKSVALGNPR